MNHPQLTPSAGTSAAGPRSDLSLWMGLDLPDPRRDRIAERRTFVAAKQTFMRAAAQADSRLGSVLSRRLRECDDLEGLLRLRFALLAALRSDKPLCVQHRNAVEAQLIKLDRC